MRIDGYLLPRPLGTVVDRRQGALESVDDPIFADAGGQVFLALVHVIAAVAADAGGDELDGDSRRIAANVRHSAQGLPRSADRPGGGWCQSARTVAARSSPMTGRVDDSFDRSARNIPKARLVPFPAAAGWPSRPGLHSPTRSSSSRRIPRWRQTRRGSFTGRPNPGQGRLPSLLKHWTLDKFAITPGTKSVVFLPPRQRHQPDQETKGRGQQPQKDLLDSPTDLKDLPHSYSFPGMGRQAGPTVSGTGIEGKRRARFGNAKSGGLVRRVSAFPKRLTPAPLNWKAV